MFVGDFRERLEAWSGSVCVNPTVWVLRRAQLRVEFHFLRKKGPFWNVFCLKEQQISSIQGRAIPLSVPGHVWARK